MTTITINRATVEQALEALENAEDQLAKPYSTDASKAITALRAALEQQAEPGPGKVVAWGVFALADGEWQLQHPVFVGDECGKENAEFERASYSGPQPLEVRPLGVVTATAQQQTKRACCTYPDCRCPIDKSTVCAKGLPEQAEPQPTPSMADITRLRAERDALADRLREVRAQLNDTIDAHRKKVVMNAWAEQKLARHGIPMPEGDLK